MFGFRKRGADSLFSPEEISGACQTLQAVHTRGELGTAIAELGFRYSPRDLEQMRWNFSSSIQEYNPEYRQRLEETITAHLHGTYQTLRLMHQQGTFARMDELLPPESTAYWKMVADACPPRDEESRLRLLKFLLAGFCMFVLAVPGHPVGMSFPGGDKVEVIEGIYYCPVRTKANDVDAALCPFCPALQTPEIGYLKPPVNASEHRKKEYIEHIHRGHHFNG